MIEILDINNYDEYHRYGVDWVTEITLKSDEELTCGRAFEWLEDKGKLPYGDITFKKISDNKFVLKSVMY